MRYDENREQPKSRRQVWEFVYQASAVAGAAEKLAKYHRGRAAWWETESKKAEAQLKKKGFEYQEEIHTMGKDVRIVGDPELAKRVAQCGQKVRDHADKEDQYTTWARALRTGAKRGKSQELTLTIEDVLFFGL